MLMCCPIYACWSVPAGLNGLQTLERIRREIGTEIKVIVLSSCHSPFVITRFLKNGASGFVCKDEAPENCIEAIRHVYSGCTYYPDVLLQKVAAQLYRQQQNSATLTRREYEFFSLCGTELSYKQIACKMHLSVRTVESYRNILFRKLDVNTRVGLAIYAINEGILPFNRATGGE